MAELEATVGPASRGDSTALARVLEIIRPIALRYCRGKIGPYDRSGVSADDVAQDICLAVLTALPRYRDESRPFMAFVYGIAGHKIADVHRATGRNKTDAVAEMPEMPSVDNNPEDKVIAFESGREIGTLLGVLSPKDRDILVLRVALGMSSEETAETMDTTPGAIRVAQHRALGKLRAAQARVAAGEPLDPKAGRKNRTRRRKKVDG
ncbi:RNA polymerase sigma factor ShbA [Aldersonia sp. NBC_00410]|nr:RNA polymerase sigma factor ShbA [Aldersonia sp. NBC_00410]